MGNIFSKKVCAARAGMSERHLERLISLGEGPPIIRLGVRKIGIADEDFSAWLASRRVVPPGHSMADRPLSKTAA
jgi:predicted DNA-binding transcriptional regulator AlpA